MLILRVFELALEFDDFLGRYLDVGFQYQHVLLCFGELGLELFHFVLVNTAVELEQRRPLLDVDVLLHQNRRDERRLGQARRQLDGVLDHLGFHGIRRDEAQADHENDQQMQSNEDETTPQAILNCTHLNSKKTSHTMIA